MIKGVDISEQIIVFISFYLFIYLFYTKHCYFGFTLGRFSIQFPDRWLSTFMVVCCGLCLFM